MAALGEAGERIAPSDRVTAGDDKPANLPRRAIPPVEKETVGLEMVFRSVRGAEPVLQQIVPDKESVHSQKIAPYQAVALPPAQHLQSLQAGTIVRCRDDPFPGVRGVVFHHPGCGRAQKRVVLDDGNPRRVPRQQRFPYPVVVSIDIDGNQIRVVREIAALQMSDDIVPRDELSKYGKLSLVDERPQFFADLPDVSFGGLDPDARPAF